MVPHADRVLIGRIDLIANGGIEVVDFKPDDRSVETLPAAISRHEGQFDAYHHAVTRVVPGDVRIRVTFGRTGESGLFPNF